MNVNPPARSDLPTSFMDFLLFLLLLAVGLVYIGGVLFAALKLALALGYVGGVVVGLGAVVVIVLPIILMTELGNRGFPRTAPAWRTLGASAIKSLTEGLLFAVACLLGMGVLIASIATPVVAAGWLLSQTTSIPLQGLVIAGVFILEAFVLWTMMRVFGWLDSGKD